MSKPKLQLPAFLDKINPKFAATVGAIIVLAYISFGLYLLIGNHQDVKLRNIEIHNMITDRERMMIHLEELKVDFQKAKNDVNTSKEQLQQKQDVIDKQEQEIKEKDAALQAKAEIKKQHDEAVARALNGTPASAASLDNNEDIAWNFFVNNGYSRAQTAGIMGNLAQEHGFNTSDVGGGLGIAQWLGGRRANLMARPNYLSIHVQLQFLHDELNGPEGAAGAAVRASGSVEGATIAFQNGFERCGACNQSRRIQLAYDILGRH